MLKNIFGVQIAFDFTKKNLLFFSTKKHRRSVSIKNKGIQSEYFFMWKSISKKRPLFSSRFLPRIESILPCF